MPNHHDPGPVGFGGPPAYGVSLIIAHNHPDCRWNLSRPCRTRGQPRPALPESPHFRWYPWWVFSRPSPRPRTPKKKGSLGREPHQLVCFASIIGLTARNFSPAAPVHLRPPSALSDGPAAGILFPYSFLSQCFPLPCPLYTFAEVPPKCYQLNFLFSTHVWYPHDASVRLPLYRPNAVPLARPIPNRNLESTFRRAPPPVVFFFLLASSEVKKRPMFFANGPPPGIRTSFFWVQGPPRKIPLPRINGRGTSLSPAKKCGRRKEFVPCHQPVKSFPETLRRARPFPLPFPSLAPVPKSPPF